MTGRRLDVRVSRDHPGRQRVGCRGHRFPRRGRGPLDEALAEQGTAEVTGGGGGLGMYNIDIEVGRDADLESVIEIIRRVLRQRNVPKTTVIKQYEPVRLEYSIYL